MADLKILVKESLNNVTPQNWVQTVNHAEQLQEEDAKQDIAVDHFLDSFIITLSESTDDEYSD